MFIAASIAGQPDTGQAGNKWAVVGLLVASPPDSRGCFCVPLGGIRVNHFFYVSGIPRGGFNYVGAGRVVWSI